MALLLGEGALRLRGVLYSVVAPDADPALRYTLIPGARGKVNGIPHTYNSHALRDRDYPQRAAQGTVRILCVGDSITFSQSQPVEGSFPKLMEASLNASAGASPAGAATGAATTAAAAAAAAPRYEVLNAGVSGYNSCQEEAFLRKIDSSYHPDVVLWQYCLNDVDKVWDPFATGNSGLLPLPLSVKRFARQHIMLWEFLRLQGYGIWQRLGYIEEDASSERYAQRIFSLWDDSLTASRDASWECVRRARQAAEAQGHRFVLAYFPMAMQTVGDPRFPDRPQKELARRCQQDGMTCLDMLPVFQARGGWDLFLKPDFLHLSDKGQQVTAETLQRELLAAPTARRLSLP